MELPDVADIAISPALPAFFLSEKILKE